MSTSRCWLAAFFLAVLQVCMAQEAEKDGPEPSDVLLFMFFGIGMGVVFMQILNKIGDPVPYTVVVFIAGILLALAYKKSTGPFCESIGMWINIDAELLLYVFLPPLVFGEAMSLNWYHAKVALPQSLVLAGPGVIVGAILMGLFAKGMFPTWSWYLAMTFGAISSATDTVAVVSLLKSAGASPKLTMIIVGESLLNDGTAMVLFEIFNNLLNGHKYTAASIFEFFVASCLGSVVFGAAVGLLTVRWLRTANRPISEIDVLMQTAITMVSAYLTFFIAQNVLLMSGVLACVASAVMVAWLGPPFILNHETMHNVWGTAEWILNTLIFLLSGLIIGNRVFEYVSAIDFLYLLVLYIVLMLIRFFVIFLSYPILSNLGHKCTWQDAAFMGWGGLRGALGMALALITYRGGPKDMEKETSSLFFYVGGMAAMTIIINATTANFVLHYLGLVGIDGAEKLMVVKSIKKKLRNHMRTTLVELATEFHFTEAEIDEVRQSVSLLNEINIEDINKDVAALKLSYEQKTLARTLSVNRLDLFGSKASASSPAKKKQQQQKAGDALPRDAIADSVVNPLHVSPAPAPPPAADLESGQESGFGLRFATITPRNSADRRPPMSSPEHGTPLYATISEEYNDDDDDDETNDEVFDVIARLEAGQNTRSAKGQNTPVRGPHVSKTLHRSLSMSARNPQRVITPELLGYVRATFLSMVRVRYWSDIEKGKIPRKSKSGKFLLYSVEVGIDEAHMHVEAGMRDWPCIEEKIDYYPLDMRLLTYWEEHVPQHWCLRGPTHYLNLKECAREERMVYILTSFISAHEHAQRKIHEFLKLEDEDENELGLQSPEELKVMTESKLSVALARRRLENINPDTVMAIRTKQAGALILTKQADFVKDMVHEGVLTTKDAEEIIAVINSDMSGINRKRNRMYREHGAATTRRHLDFHRLEEDDEAHGGGVELIAATLV